MEKENIKEQLYHLCQAFVETRLETIQNTIIEIQESLTSETKSSAGDKHETGRAMLQLEREKAGNQLAEIQKTKAILTKVNVTKTSEYIGLGSLIYTTQANYFIAISAGSMSLNNESFYTISPDTPIGKLLMGKTIDSQIIFRDQMFTVVDVF
ncbi:3-oxoacyl-ACP synthase [Tamlana sp. 2_MG-2023]|uniref:3-oxoacyl-ACP synthase n=1 Tax=unclassified Tamlana TaxID=2614803 RepID=UPI0026E39899|nr:MULTISPECIES: 3-oxoacyl-ACP synthase [unclassified Tamlana]MDO6759638.1 3-oxoacyl-ACP synthase [Tamlana sp. 2_MG-2023]MDO6791261.1 3-oxoacyl-ACP synthase [Tamlana sp. 1_MG-2023]